MSALNVPQHHQTKVTGTPMKTASSFSRLPGAFRLQFSVPSVMVWVPVLVFFASWAIAVGITVWIRYSFMDSPELIDEPIYTLAAQSTLWTLAFMAALAASHTFPFAMALSYSRRVYVMGTFLAFAVVSIGFGVLFVLAALVERATGGFWADTYTFDLPVLTESSGLLAVGAMMALLCLLVMMFGFFWSILYRRVRMPVLWGVILGVALMVMVIAVLVMQIDGWPTIIAWFTRQTVLSLTGWMLVPAVALTLINYAVIRKAVPMV